VGYVGKYDATTGAVIKAKFITGLGPYGIAVKGPNASFPHPTLFVAFAGLHPAVGKYDATTGEVIKADFITGPNFAPLTLAVSGNALFVVNIENFAVDKYNATTGEVIKADFITRLPNWLNTLAVSGNTLFVVDPKSGTVGNSDATTGEVSIAAPITGLNSPFGVAVKSAK
jgi:hypothetical protein